MAYEFNPQLKKVEKICKLTHWVLQIKHNLQRDVGA